MSTSIEVRKPPRPAVPPDVCLDFVNTRCWRGRAEPSEQFQLPQDVGDWAVKHAGAAQATLSPQGFVEALALREALRRLLLAQGAGEAPAAADFATLNAALASAPARATLAHTGAGYSWQTNEPTVTDAAAAMLAPVLWSASDLLAAGGRVRVRACANPECQWMFIDASRNGSRRWCDMASCGNRAKAQRHYRRAKAAQP